MSLAAGVLQAGAHDAQPEPTGAEDSPWVLALDAGTSDVEERDRVAAGLARMDVGRFGWLVLHTCRRLEVLGSGPAPEPATLARRMRAPEAARFVVHAGSAAIVRVARLAAGLESAVVGEREILGQVRRVRRMADAVPGVDPRLVRVLDCAIGVGRRARAERPLVETSLADRAVAWLVERHGALDGARLLVAGTGPMGRAVARRARLAGAIVTIAGRRGTASTRTLGEAVHLVDGADLLVVALAGPWAELASADGPLPLAVDLSAPPAIPDRIRALMGSRLATLDELARREPVDELARARRRAYTAHASRLVAEAAGALAVDARRHERAVLVRAITDEAEARRAAAVDRLLHRLPDLTGHERDLVEQLSRQLVAGTLHRPLARLGDDPTGSRLAAARDLLGP